MRHAAGVLMKRRRFVAMLFGMIGLLAFKRVPAPPAHKLTIWLNL
jgi:hypothetical protein